MNKVSLALARILCVSGAALASSAHAQTTITPIWSEGSQDDLFNGAVVTAASPLYTGFTAADAFGATTAGAYNAETQAGGHVIFADAGTSFINFQTAAPVTIAGFNIFASSDRADNPFRGFNAVRLFSSLDEGATYTNLLGSVEYNPALGPVQIATVIGSTTAQYFRVEGDSSNGGARLMEIDAIEAAPAFAATAAVPEPATWAMMLLGFGAIGGALRRRQKVATSVRVA